MLLFLLPQPVLFFCPCHAYYSSHCLFTAHQPVPPPCPREKKAGEVFTCRLSPGPAFQVCCCLLQCAMYVNVIMDEGHIQMMKAGVRHLGGVFPVGIDSSSPLLPGRGDMERRERGRREEREWRRKEGRCSGREGRRGEGDRQDGGSRQAGMAWKMPTKMMFREKMGMEAGVDACPVACSLSLPPPSPSHSLAWVCLSTT